LGFVLRRARVFLVVMAASLFALAVTAGPAHAWYRGNVWVNFGDWNCPAGGVVTGIYWAVDDYSSGPAGGDWGDRVIYPSVRIGGSNTLSYQLMCKKWGWYQYKGVVSQRTFTPSRSGQSYTF
jgi:hypothetical protein